MAMMRASISVALALALAAAAPPMTVDTLELIDPSYCSQANPAFVGAYFHKTNTCARDLSGASYSGQWMVYQAVQAGLIRFDICTDCNCMETYSNRPPLQDVGCYRSGQNPSRLYLFIKPLRLGDNWLAIGKTADCTADTDCQPGGGLSCVQGLCKCPANTYLSFLSLPKQCRDCPLNQVSPVGSMSSTDCKPGAPSATSTPAAASATPSSTPSNTPTQTPPVTPSSTPAAASASSTPAVAAESPSSTPAAAAASPSSTPAATPSSSSTPSSGSSPSATPSSTPSAVSASPSPMTGGGSAPGLGGAAKPAATQAAPAAAAADAGLGGGAVAALVIFLVVLPLGTVAGLYCAARNKVALPCNPFTSGPSQAQRKLAGVVVTHNVLTNVSVNAGGEPPLPHGWSQHADADNHVYFVGPDGSSTWTRPA